MRRLVATVLIVGAIALVVVFIVFGLLPLIRSVKEGADAQTKLDYIVKELNKARGDEEVASIMNAYEARFSIPAETDANGNPVTYTTTTPPTTTESTTESTTALTAFIAETPPTSSETEATTASQTKKK